MFDAIVIGSGMSGGIAAKELCERGLKTLVIERGRKIEHGADYTDWMQPWETPNANMICGARSRPSTPATSPSSHPTRPAQWRASRPTSAWSVIRMPSPS